MTCSVCALLLLAFVFQGALADQVSKRVDCDSRPWRQIRPAPGMQSPPVTPCLSLQSNARYPALFVCDFRAFLVANGLS
jgi:hypothetical protein